jgi:hypothetical protein
VSKEEDKAMLRSAILKLIDAVVYHLGVCRVRESR